jgi:hypothetical protein
MAEQICGDGEVNELSKIASSTAELRKSADRMWKQLEDMGEQLDGLNSRLAKLESKEGLAGFLRSRVPGAGRGDPSSGAEGNSMNLAHSGNLNKLARASDLWKQTAQSDNLSDKATRALQALSQAVVESPADESLQEMLSSFLRALAAYDSGIDKDPARAARLFGQEIDRIVRDRQFGRAVQSSLQKGMSPAEFFRR